MSLKIIILNSMNLCTNIHFWVNKIFRPLEMGLEMRKGNFQRRRIRKVGNRVGREVVFKENDYIQSNIPHISLKFFISSTIPAKHV